MYKKIISSKDITKEYGLPYSTITYYTNLGFLRVVKRKGNKRLYNRDEIDRQLARITALKDRGYPLRLIRKKLIL